MRKKWFSIGGLGVIGGAIIAALSGTPRPTPRPTVDPGPTAVRVAVTVLQGDRQAAPDLSCRLVVDQLPTDTGPTEAFPCEYNGVQAAFSIPADRTGRGGYLSVSATGYESQSLRVVVHNNGTFGDSDDKIFEIHLVPDTVPLPRLVTRGQYIQLENGQRWTYIGATDFNLLSRYVRGEDIRPVLTQRSELGFNVLRVLTAFDVCAEGRDVNGNPCQPMGRLHPSPSVYTSIPGFLREVSKYGMYVELVGFAGKWSPSATDDEMVQHWENLINSASGSTNALLELANEYNNPPNAGVPLDRMRRPSTLFASNASAVQDSIPRLPIWTYATYRPGGGPEWMRKVAHNGMEDVADKFNVPTVANETTRFPDNDNNPDHAFDAAAGAALLSAGSTFHSVHGKNSTLFEGIELQAARQWAAGARSVPFSCQGEAYQRPDDPNYLRVYRRGSDPACVVRIRR